MPFFARLKCKYSEEGDFKKNLLKVPAARRLINGSSSLVAGGKLYGLSFSKKEYKKKLVSYDGMRWMPFLKVLCW